MTLRRRIVEISAGLLHGAFLTRNGDVWSWRFGVLGAKGELLAFGGNIQCQVAQGGEDKLFGPLLGGGEGSGPAASGGADDPMRGAVA